MKASRAAIKTAKAVVSVEERLTLIEDVLRELVTAMAVDRAGLEEVLKKLVAAISADKPSEQGQDAPPKARTVRKRGGA